MKLKDIGERALLNLAKEICEEDSSIMVGIGDDGAVIELEKDLLVVTTDMLIEGIHFSKDTRPQQIGKKSVVVNLSDLAAMGADPKGLVYSVGLPEETEVEFVSNLLKSMNSTAKSYDTSIVGGDLNEAEEIIVSGTAFGITTKERLLLRSGAKEGDIIGITGELGASSTATRALLKNIPLDDNPELKKSLQEPSAGIKEAKILSKNSGVNSAIDITDGLAANLWQISNMSEVGLLIEYDKLPINQSAKTFAEKNNFEMDKIVLYGGEDFELLFTAEPEEWKNLENEFKKIDTRISKIGKVKEKKGVNIRKDGEVEELPNRGYEHFRRWET